MPHVRLSSERAVRLRAHASGLTARLSTYSNRRVLEKVESMDNQTMPLVLVADDEPGMLALVTQHIRTLGYPVVEASDGEQALQIAETQLPDLVVLDVMMPAMSGWEVCRKIRENVALAHTGIVMLTGIGENLNELTSPLYGADAYIDKPFDFSELDQKVRAVLAKRAGQRDDLPGLARTEPEQTASGAPAAERGPAPAAKKPEAKKAPARKAPRKKAKKAPAKKAPAKKAPAKKAPAKKAKKTPPKKLPRKAPPKKKRIAGRTKKASDRRR